MLLKKIMVSSLLLAQVLSPLALAQTGAPVEEAALSDNAFEISFQTAASYLTFEADGQLALQLPQDVDLGLDPEVVQDLEQLVADHNQSLETGATASENLRIPGAKYAVKYALRHGGKLLGKIVGKLNKKWGAWVTKNGDRIADMLDAYDAWAEGPIILGLMKMGMPYPEAHTLATVPVNLV